MHFKTKTLLPYEQEITCLAGGYNSIKRKKKEKANSRNYIKKKSFLNRLEYAKHKIFCNCIDVFKI